MLMENVISRVDVKKILKQRLDLKGALWTCPCCKNSYNVDDIEDFVDTDLRNPSDEYFMCPKCEYHASLLRDGVVVDKKDKYKIYSDGTMLYAKDKEGWFWLV